MKNVRSVLMMAVSISLLVASAQAQTKGDYNQGPTKGQVGQGGNGGYRPQQQPQQYPAGTKGNPGYGSRPQPQQYPPGTKGNPGYGRPQQYPQQYPQSRPVVVYPQSYSNYRFPAYPSANIAPCVVLSIYDGYSTTYQVLDSRGRVTETAYSYAQALAAAEVQERIGNCYGVVFQSASNNYPSQNGSQYPTSANFCQIMNGRNAYGQTLYRVLDRAGRVLVTTTDYSQAQYVSRSDARCFQYN